MGEIELLRELYESRRLDEASSAYIAYCGSGVPDAEAHLYGALIAWRQGRPQESRMALQRARALGPVGSVKARCHFTAGILAREAGDTQAVAEFDACMAMLPDLPELRGILLGACLYNKALAFELMRGHKAEALALYLQAVVEFQATGMTDYLRQALQNAAWTAVDLGDFTQAADLLDQAAPLCTNESALWIQRVALARLQGRQGAWTEAARLCQWVLTDETTALGIRCRAAAVAAETLLHQGNVAEARVMGQHAVTLALQTTDNLCLSFANRVHSEAKQANTGAS